MTQKLAVKHTLNDYVSKLSELKNTVTNNLIKIGQLLYDIKSNDLYREQYDTFDEFIAIPELSFSRFTAYKAMRIYEVFIDEYAVGDLIEGIDCDKLYRITGIVNNQNVEEWIDKARALSRSDLNAEVNEIKGLPPKPTTLELIDLFLKKFGLLKEPREIILAWESWKKDKSYETDRR